MGETDKTGKRGATVATAATAATPDWDHLRVFLQLARTPRLAEAAPQLGVDQSTVSRRIRRLEQRLGSRLFDRSNQGYTLTTQGQALVAHAEQMEATMQAAAEQVGGHNQALSGLVRIGATEGFGTFVLAPQLAHFCARHPGLQVDLLPVPRFVSLSRREADFAVAVERPAEGSYVVARLCDYRLQLYATAAYLRGQPPILSPRDLPRHPFYGYVDELVFSPELRYLQQVSPGLAQPLRSSSVIAQYTAVQRGQGLAILPCFLAAQDPALVPVLAEQVLLQRSFWLVAPPELRRIARIRAAWDYLRRMAELNRAFLMGEAREMRYISR